MYNDDNLPRIRIYQRHLPPVSDDSQLTRTDGTKARESKLYNQKLDDYSMLLSYKVLKRFDWVVFTELGRYSMGLMSSSTPILRSLLFALSANDVLPFNQPYFRRGQRHSGYALSPLAGSPQHPQLMSPPSLRASGLPRRFSALTTKTRATRRRRRYFIVMLRCETE